MAHAQQHPARAYPCTAQPRGRSRKLSRACVCAAWRAALRTALGHIVPQKAGGGWALEKTRFYVTITALTQCRVGLSAALCVCLQSVKTGTITGERAAFYVGVFFFLREPVLTTNSCWLHCTLSVPNPKSSIQTFELMVYRFDTGVECDKIGGRCTN